MVPPKRSASCRRRKKKRRKRSNKNELPLSLTTINSAAEFEAISIAASDLISNGRVAKFLIDRRDATQPVVRFINGNFTEGGVVPESARFHYMFALAVLGIGEPLEEFNTVTYFTNDKRYVAGVLHSDFLDGATDPVYGLQFYPQDVINEGTIVEALRVIKEQITIMGVGFRIVPTGSQQTTATVAAELAAAGLPVLPLDQILGTIQYIPLNLGEAWGFIRIFPMSNDELRPTDIPVFDELPLDLSVVAGVLIRAVQDTNSHVNLKSKERHTPNAVLRNAAPDNPRLCPVRQPSGPPDCGAGRTSHSKRRPRRSSPRSSPSGCCHPLLSLSAGSRSRKYDVPLSQTAKSSRTAALAASRRYGSKAGNLAFLAHRLVLGRVDDAGSPTAIKGYDLVPTESACRCRPTSTWSDLRPTVLPVRSSMSSSLPRRAARYRPGNAQPRSPRCRPPFGLPRFHQTRSSGCGRS